MTVSDVRGVLSGSVDYRHPASSSTTATENGPSGTTQQCRCDDFMAAAVALGYDVSLAASPLDLGRGFRYVADDPCGLAIGMRVDPLLADDGPAGV